MTFTRGQIRSLSLSGTVSVPAQFPELGELFVLPCTPDGRLLPKGKSNYILRVVQRSSVKTSITRNFLLDDVAAVFLPANKDRVQLEKGQWLLGAEIGEFFACQSVPKGASNLGIAYVPEAASCLMQVEVGMTAAESAEYYPPLPGDRSIDHYRFDCDPCSGYSRPPVLE